MLEKRKEQIRKTLAETRKRRLTQRCLTYEFKIKINKLNKKEIEKLNFMFVQCKWLYNYIIGLENAFTFDTKNNCITSLDKDGKVVNRELTIPAKMKEAVKDNIERNIRILAAHKRKGNKIGQLKFKSEINSIELKQYGITHQLRGKGFKINGFKKVIPVFGLGQLEGKNLEYANARIVRKATGYYIKLTCFENLTSSHILKPNKEVGLDFGIKTNVTTSDNEKFNVSIKESERLKGLQRKLSRQTKGSNSREQTLYKIRVEYEKLSNRKKDSANKLINYLCQNYSTVYMQDEMVAKWKKDGFGKQVQTSCLGYLKVKLKQQPNVQIIDKSYPTTKLCYNCGTLHKEITLRDRQFVCPNCGFSEERDLKAAKTILFMGQCKNTYAPMGHRSTGAEKMSDFLASIEERKQSSKKHESSLNKE